MAKEPWLWSPFQLPADRNLLKVSGVALNIIYILRFVIQLHKTCMQLGKTRIVDFASNSPPQLLLKL